MRRVPHSRLAGKSLFFDAQCWETNKPDMRQHVPVRCMSKTQIARERTWTSASKRSRDSSLARSGHRSHWPSWTVKSHGQECKCVAFTSMDTVTNCPELMRVNNKTSLHLAQQFENSWLSRCPRPMPCTCHQGSKSTGLDFQAMLDDCNIQRRPIAVKKSTSQRHLRTTASNSNKRLASIATCTSSTQCGQCSNAHQNSPQHCRMLGLGSHAFNNENLPWSTGFPARCDTQHACHR
jgi:hypothetical protein